MIIMATKKRQNKLKKKIEDLEFEIAMLRSAIIGLSWEKDSEGEYKPEFVERILALTKKKQKTSVFTTGKDFLKEIRKAT